MAAFPLTTEALATRPAAHVCRRIARAILPDPSGAPASVGEVTLMPHQREAVALVRQSLRRVGGALLADPVGTGKTFVALAVAAQYPNAIIVAPASLRAMWRQALGRAQVSAPILSFEGLSRGILLPDESWGLLIVDEAHHVRNRATRRFDTVAQLAWGRDVLLLTATPVHNRTADLHALCSLFLGEAACHISAESLARLACRRLQVASAALPTVAAPEWMQVADDRDVLEAIRRLPPPVPPADGGVAVALGTLVLIRQWCSSEAALRAAIERRLTTGLGMQARLADGGQVTRDDLRRWIAAAGTVQLDLPFQFTPGGAPATELVARVAAHVEALRALRDLLMARGDGDSARFAHLRRILGLSPPARVVMFTHSVDTARAIYRALAPRWQCAVLGGRTTRIAAGSARREELIAQFQPGTAGRAPPAMHLDVLIATDVLSEGVDLHDAGMLVHLDLPWTMARLQQRLGRLRRLGATHTCIRQFAFEPPGGADGVLRLVQRITRKAGIAHRSVGDDPLSLAIPQREVPRRWTVPGESAADLTARLHAMLRAWDGGGAPAPDENGVTEIAVVEGNVRSITCLALVETGEGPRLAVLEQGQVSADPACVVQACALFSPGRDGAPPPLDPRLLQLTHRKFIDWARQQHSRVDLHVTAGSWTHRQVHRRLGAAFDQTGRLARQSVSGHVARARRLLNRSVGAGAERALHRWLADHPPSRVTSEAIEGLADTLAKRARRDAPALEVSVLALLFIVPPEA